MFFVLVVVFLDKIIFFEYKRKIIKVKLRERFGEKYYNICFNGIKCYGKIFIILIGI